MLLFDVIEQISLESVIPPIVSVIPTAHLPKCVVPQSVAHLAVVALQLQHHLSLTLSEHVPLSHLSQLWGQSIQRTAQTRDMHHHVINSLHLAFELHVQSTPLLEVLGHFGVIQSSIRSGSHTDFQQRIPEFPLLVPVLVLQFFLQID